MSILIELAANNPQWGENLAPAFGFDAACVVWARDAEVRRDLRRLLAHARLDPVYGFKTLAKLDLSAEAPFRLEGAWFEDVIMDGLILPRESDLTGAVFIGADILGLNFQDFIMSGPALAVECVVGAGLPVTVECYDCLSGGESAGEAGPVPRKPVPTA